MNWPLVSLKDVSSLGPQYGANLKAITPNGRGVRYVRITDIDEFGQLRDDSVVEPDEGDIADYLLQDGDLLLARTGATVGKSYKYSSKDGDCAFAGYLIRFRPDKEIIHPVFLTYYLQTQNYLAWVQSRKRVAAQPNINGAEYAALQVPLPALSEQCRIVELLYQADALRRLRRVADAKAARVLPALFLKMFGDPSANPMGWKAGSLGEFGARARYGLGQPPKLSEGGLPLLRATNVDAGSITTKNLIFVDAADVPASRNAFLSANEVLVVRSGAYTGDVAQVTETWEGAVAGYDMVLTPPDGWQGEFIEQFLLTPFVQRGYFDSQKGRAGQPHLNSKQLEATPAFAPPERLQEEFAEKVRSVRRLRDQCEVDGEKLEHLFNVLLQKAFSGELTMKWRQAHMQEVLAEMRQQAKALNLPMPQGVN
jgi:type I restriction enzyme, S subunit